MRKALCAAVVIGAAALHAPAAAQGSAEAIEEANNPFIAELGIGPSIFLTACGGGDCFSGSLTQFKISQLFGYHVSGDGEGFGIGLGLSEAFGSDFFRFQPGLRLWGDIRLVDDVSVFLVPQGHIGYGLWTASFGGLGTATAHFFNWAAGLGLRVVLYDVATIGFTPIGLDFFANDDGFAMFYDLTFGFGVTF